ncbi:tetratricopeptide repeat protein [Rhizobium sp. C1]|uniref:tetratricopeptide repeat protein n=1 Tax=Rhizobium sp. C1 TaxID=1349799 RepID=UPI003FA6DCA3
MTLPNFKMLAATLAIAVAMPAAAFAVGSETDQTKPPAKTETSTKCKDGEVWDKDKKKCVNPKKSSLDDDTLYQAARELAYAGQYRNALKVLSAMKNQDEPRVLNYKGYANRKAGNMKLGMNYYRQALAKDPNFILARSYMGMAYVEQGNVKEANKQLLEIRERGGSNTWAYTALKQTIASKTRY